MLINSSTLHSASGKDLKKAIKEKSNHINFFKDANDFIKSLRVYNANVQDITDITLNTIAMIWNDLKQNHSFKFIFTRRLNTDPLENFFGSIRQQGVE